MQPTPQKPEDDERVFDRVLAGDVDAFEDIVVRWQGPLLNLAYRYCRDRGLAEEMAQEAFLKVFKNLQRWRRDSRFSTWMFSIAANHYRTTLRKHRPEGIDLAELNAIAAPGDLAGKMEAADSDGIVRRAVSLLPEKYRDALVVYYFKEQDVNETAGTLGIQPGTVKARLHRARKLLKTKLQALGHPLALMTQERGK